MSSRIVQDISAERQFWLESAFIGRLNPGFLQLRNARQTAGANTPTRKPRRNLKATTTPRTFLKRQENFR